MTVPYEYIVASLPDIVFDEIKLEAGLHSFISELREQIPQKDTDLLSYVGYPIDNRNLLNILLHKQDPVLQVGNFAEEEIREEIRNPDQFPEYMQTFLSAHSDSMKIIQNLSWENQLYWLFYEHATELDNRFLRRWFTFEMDLRNILTAVKCRRTESPLEEHIIGRNEITDLIFKSNALDFGLPAKHHWTDELFTVDYHDVAKSEEWLVRFRLQHLEDLAEPGLFRIETILLTGFALTLAERWDMLDPGAGRARLEELINTLEAGSQAK